MDRKSFWKNVRIGSPAGCWAWLGSTDRDGYGRCTNKGKTEGSHRLAYMLATGPIAAGMEIRHSCDNPPCCNPAHLLQGTKLDNVRDRIARDRSARGSQNGQAKLTEQEAAEVLADYRKIKGTAAKAPPGLLQALADRTGVAADTIQDLVRGRTWRHLH